MIHHFFEFICLTVNFRCPLKRQKMGHFGLFWGYRKWEFRCPNQNSKFPRVYWRYAWTWPLCLPRHWQDPRLWRCLLQTTCLHRNYKTDDWSRHKRRLEISSPLSLPPSKQWCGGKQTWGDVLEVSDAGQDRGHCLWIRLKHHGRQSSELGGHQVLDQWERKVLDELVAASLGTFLLLSPTFSLSPARLPAPAPIFLDLNCFR